MPRKKTKSLQRKIYPDRQYNSVLVQRLINKVMLDGKKMKAEGLVYRAFDEVGLKTKQDPLKVFEEAFEKAAPQLEVKSRRVGGATYQVPFEVKGPRKNHITLTWFVNAARARKGQPFDKALANEILDAYNETGTVMKKREEMHRMAEANRAFAHFARY